MQLVTKLRKNCFPTNIIEIWQIKKNNNNINNIDDILIVIK